MQSCKKHQRQGKIVLFDDKSKKADRILLFMNEAIHKDESLMVVSVNKKRNRRTKFLSNILKNWRMSEVTSTGSTC